MIPQTKIFITKLPGQSFSKAFVVIMVEFLELS